MWNIIPRIEKITVFPHKHTHIYIHICLSLQKNIGKLEIADPLTFLYHN